MYDKYRLMVAFAAACAMGFSAHSKDYQVAKLNSDNVPDVIALDGGVLVQQLGLGDGTLSVSTAITLDFTPAIIDVGDTNADQHTDIVAIDTNGVLSVSLNDTVGGFNDDTTLDIGLNALETVVDMSVGFINDDSLLDIAVLIGGLTNARVVILENDGNGGFNSFVDVGIPGLTVAALSLSITDLNGDGYGDFVVNDILGNLYSVLSDGLGDMNLPNISLFGLPAGNIYFKDMNGDGHVDMIGLDSGLGLLTLRLGGGDGSFGAGTPVSVGVLPGDVVVADINRDGHQDVIAVNLGDNSATVLLGDGLGGLTEAVGQLLTDLFGSIAGLGVPQGVLIGDFNRDCYPDLGVWDELVSEYIMTLNQLGPSPEDLVYCSLFEEQSSD